MWEKGANSLIPYKKQLAALIGHNLDLPNIEILSAVTKNNIFNNYIKTRTTENKEVKLTKNENKLNIVY